MIVPAQLVILTCIYKALLKYAITEPIFRFTPSTLFGTEDSSKETMMNNIFGSL